MLVGKEREEVLFSGCRVSVWEDENVLEMDSGDGCATARMCLMLWNCALKNG